MSRDWYETYAGRFGGYRQLWNSRIEGENGEVAFTAWLRETIPAYPRVLDVGCGDGLYTLHMSALASQITGVDYAPTMIELSRRNQQSAGITNVDFHVCDTSREPLPGQPGEYDLIYSRRGPSSHLLDARRVLLPGGLVAGIHTGGREQILNRLEAAGFRIVWTQTYEADEVLPTVEDYARYLSRLPGFPNFTAPERRAELEARAEGARTEQGYVIHRWWFIWVATPADG